MLVLELFDMMNSRKRRSFGRLSMVESAKKKNLMMPMSPAGQETGYGSRECKMGWNWGVPQASIKRAVECVWSVVKWDSSGRKERLCFASGKECLKVSLSLVGWVGCSVSKNDGVPDGTMMERVTSTASECVLSGRRSACVGRRCDGLKVIIESRW